MFTGVYPYRELLKMALHPWLQGRLLVSFLRDFTLPPLPRPPLVDNIPGETGLPGDLSF